MGALERMRAQLKPTGLYRLDGKSRVEAELKQYAVYLDQFDSDIARLPDNAFLDTVSVDGLDAWQRLFALPRHIYWEDMRRVAAARLAITNRDFTKEGVRRCMASGGFAVELTEDFSNGLVTVEIVGDKGIFGTKAEKEAFLQGCLPCHARGVFIWNN